MHPTPFDHMQRAVDVVNNSEHPQNKIAATIAGEDFDGSHYSVVHTNFWPEIIKGRIGPDTRIGNASGTIHAETACILKSPCTEGASIFVTDPICPNCAKNIAEAGIRNVYIDHKGFEKDFLTRRREFFEHMSLAICEKAGINVYEIRRREERITPILETAANRAVHIETPVELQEAHSSFVDFIAKQERLREDTPFAIGFGHERAKDRTIALIAPTHPVAGLSSRLDSDLLARPDGKYSYIMEPVNRLLMNAARLGIRLDHNHLYSSRLPTAREQVNLIGADVHRLHVGNLHDARDLSAYEAMRLLESKRVLAFEALEDATT